MFRVIQKIVVLSLCALSVPSVTHAFGVSPGSAEILNIKQGDVHEETFYVSHGQVDREVCQYTLSVPGEDQYFMKLDKNFIEANVEHERLIPFTVSIDTRSLGVGEYESYIQITEAQVGTDQIDVGMRLPVSFSVTNKEIRDFKISKYSVGVPDQNRLFVRLDMINDGNVDEHVDRIEIVLKRGGIDTGAEPILIPLDMRVAPRSDASYQGQLPISVQPGPVSVHSKLYSVDGDVVYEEEHDFVVHEVNIIDRSLDKNITYTHIGFIILLFFGILGLLVKKVRL